MEMNRRQFLANTLAGSLLLSGLHIPALAAARTSTDPFQLVPLGQSGLKVSLIGFGTGMRGGNRQSNITRMGREKAVRLLQAGYDKGIRFFDCADLYGSHGSVAEALKGKPRQDYVIGSKIWVMPGKAVDPNDGTEPKVAIDRFRKELGTDYLDFVQIHCMSKPGWMDTYKKQMDDLDELKEKGIIRGHGVSVHSLDAMQACAGKPWVDTLHVRINAFGDAMDKKDPAEVIPTIEKLHAEGKGVIGMKVVGEGRYTPAPEKIDKSIRTALACVNTMIVGFDTEAQIDDFAARVKKALEEMKA